MRDGYSSFSNEDIGRIFHEMMRNLDGVKPMPLLAKLSIDEREKQLSIIESKILEILGKFQGEMDVFHLADLVSDDLLCDIGDVSIGLARLATYQIDLDTGTTVKLIEQPTSDAE